MEFARQMAEIIEQFVSLEKNNVFSFDKNIKLFPSEIQLLLVINNGLTVNSTEMANVLGVTKGAISQTISRLERKGIIVKTKDPKNKNEITILFTPLGKKVVKECDKWKNIFHDNFNAYYLALSKNDQKVLTDFFLYLKNLLNKHKKK